MNIYWSDYVIKVVTNSSVLSATFDSSKEELSIDISGETGTSGFANITAPKAIINASEEIGVKLDGAPIEFTLTQNTTHYFIHIEYTHSTHKLTTSFEKTVGENANGEEKKAEPKEKGEVVSLDQFRKKEGEHPFTCLFFGAIILTQTLSLYVF